MVGRGRPRGAREEINGEVLVEGSDEVIAVLPGIRDGVVALMASRLRASDDSDPMASPSFPEVGEARRVTTVREQAESPFGAPGGNRMNLPNLRSSRRGGGSPVIPMKEPAVRRIAGPYRFKR